MDRTDWQPIETAPKPKTPDDPEYGNSILLASTSGHRAIGYWYPGGEIRLGGWYNIHDHERMEYWNAFTHWMPLPPPPRTTEQ